MKKLEINYVGCYRLNNIRHCEPYWASKVSVNGTTRTIVDAAGVSETGENVVRLLPYGPTNSELDGVLHDGDLLAYTQGPLNVNCSKMPSPDAVLNVIKGRASHAELGYAEPDGKPRQVSLWGTNPIVRPYDRPFHEHTDNDAISIYRVSLAGYGIDAERETALKAEVKRWRQIVQPVRFPLGREMNIDPVDFTTVEELKGIAAKLLMHSPNDGNPPFGFKLNCAQWSTLTFSLAVCCPLSRTMLKANGWLADYERNWVSLGFAADGLAGIDELPIPFYTIRDAVENALDLYLPDEKGAILSKVDFAAVSALMNAHGIRLDQRVIMPSAFMIENRLRGEGVPRKTKSVFSYVATAVPEWELRRV